MQQIQNVQHGNDLETWSHYPGYLSVKQFEAVKAIVEDPSFHKACCNPLDPWEYTEHGRYQVKYKGPTTFLYYTQNGALNAVRLAQSGRELQRVCTN